MDGPSPQTAQALPPDPPAYTYAATDYRPRQPREIALCTKASEFDWMYTGAMTAGLVGSEMLNFGPLKQSNTSQVRLLGPGFVGFFWGSFLAGGYLSLPTCDPLWASGPPPEGNVRLEWPLGAAIALLASVSAPALDYVFLGPVPSAWTDTERSSRYGVAMGAGLLGAIFPYIVPPKTWAAKREIERLRASATPAGGFVSYGFAF